jgi:hypothetical protein
VKLWKSRILSTVLATSALLLVWATPALAAPACNGFVIASGNTFTVCIEKINNGYNATATHESGPTYLVDFNLDTNEGTFGDEGAFLIGPGQQRTYFFAVGFKQWAQVKLYWRSGSPEFPPMFSPVQ